MSYYKNDWIFIEGRETFPNFDTMVYALVEEDTKDDTYPFVIKCRLEQSPLRSRWVIDDPDDYIEEGFMLIPQDYTVLAYRYV